MYFKYLEKASLVLQSSHTYHQLCARQTLDPFQDASHTPLAAPFKIQYLNTNFTRKLSDQEKTKDCFGQLSELHRHDVVLLPYFSDCKADRRALLVAIRVSTFTVDLFDRERDDDSKFPSCLIKSIDHDISDMVIHMLDMASQLSQVDFSEDQIDGGVEGVCVQRDEDMLVAMCYVADCLTFNKPIDLETFNPKIERLRIIETLLALFDLMKS